MWDKRMNKDTESIYWVVMWPWDVASNRIESSNRLGIEQRTFNSLKGKFVAFALDHIFFFVITQNAKRANKMKNPVHFDAAAAAAENENKRTKNS